MEQIQTYKKKAIFFPAVVIIAEQIMRFGLNAIMANSMSVTESIDADRYNMISRIVSLCLTAFTIALTFIMGYIFTRDKKKTVLFAGSVYFGKKAAGLVESLISTVANSLGYAGVIGGSDMSAVIFVGEILIIPLFIALAYFAFTAFEGINQKLEGSLDSSEMLLSRARKRLIAAYLVAGVVVGVIESAPNFIFAFLDIDMRLSFIISVVTSVITWLCSVISFAVIYFAGYKPYNSHHDAIAFISALGISNVIIGFFTAIVMLPLNTFIQSAINAENYQTMAILAGVTGAVSLIATVFEIAFIIYILKFFFATAKITLFEQGAAPLYNQEINQEAYEAPSAITGVKVENESEEATEVADEE